MVNSNFEKANKNAPHLYEKSERKWPTLSLIFFAIIQKNRNYGPKRSLKMADTNSQKSEQKRATPSQKKQTKIVAPLLKKILIVHFWLHNFCDIILLYEVIMKDKISKLVNVYKKYGFIGFCKKCKINCWSICNVQSEIKKKLWIPAWWLVRNKFIIIK